MNESVDGSGFNPDYGLYGSNKATEDTVKLFPRDCHPFVTEVQTQLQLRTGKHVEVMVYGDGAFCDPVGHIWELADRLSPPLSPTACLEHPMRSSSNTWRTTILPGSRARPCARLSPSISQKNPAISRTP